MARGGRLLAVQGQPKHNLICPTVSFSQVLKIASGVTIVPAWVMARGGRLLAVQGQRKLETKLSQTSTNAGLLKLLPECPNNRMTIIMKKNTKKHVVIENKLIKCCA